MPSTRLPIVSTPYLDQPEGKTDGPKMLRIEARNSLVPIERKPEWIKTKLKTGPEYTQIMDLVKSGSYFPNWW
jgi:lipoic acid synthetase